MQGFIDWLKENGGVVVGSASLLFTLFSYYRLNHRRGKLQVAPPRSYEIAQPKVSKSNPRRRAIVRLPLVFFNDGAVPIVVQNLQLIFLDQVGDRQTRPFRFWATLKHMTTKDIAGGKPVPLDQERRLAYQFPVKGREALSLVCEFWGQPDDILIGTVGAKRIEVRAMLDHNSTWQSLFTANLRFTEELKKAWMHAEDDLTFIPISNSEVDDEIYADE